MVLHRYFAHAGPGSTMTAASSAPATSTGPKASRRREPRRRHRPPLRFPGGRLHRWMHWAPHRQNLLDPGFRDAGVGVGRGFPMRGRRRGDLHARFWRPQRATPTAKSRHSLLRYATRLVQTSRNARSSKVAGSCERNRPWHESPDRDRRPRPRRRPLSPAPPGATARALSRRPRLRPPDRPRGRGRDPGARDALHDQLRPRARRPHASATPPSSTARRGQGLRHPPLQQLQPLRLRPPVHLLDAAPGYLRRAAGGPARTSPGARPLRRRAAIFTAWVHSPEHLANILGRYCQIGIAPRDGRFGVTVRSASGPSTSAATAAPPRAATTGGGGGGRGGREGGEGGGGEGGGRGGGGGGGRGGGRGGRGGG